jgi:hypothetical protein
MKSIGQQMQFPKQGPKPIQDGDWFSPPFTRSVHHPDFYFFFFLWYGTAKVRAPGLMYAATGHESKNRNEIIIVNVYQIAGRKGISLLT